MHRRWLSYARTTTYGLKLESRYDKKDYVKEIGMVASALCAFGICSELKHSGCDADVQERDEEYFRKRFQIKEKLGAGGFAVVHRAVENKTGREYAAKFLKSDQCPREQIMDEIRIMRRAGEHKNIVSLHEAFDLSGQIVMLLDLVKGGELFDFVVEKGSMFEYEASALLRQVCLGLQHLHLQGISHRDIKPENILLSSKDESARPQIADFGLSRVIRHGEMLVIPEPDGTWAYWAPEVIKKQSQDYAVDMWAFGLVTYILLTGTHPFDPAGCLSDTEIIRRIITGDYDRKNGIKGHYMHLHQVTCFVENIEWFRNLSDSAKDFISHLLEKNPKKRYTAEDALKHPWLSGAISQDLPILDGQIDRLIAYQRLQQLRANVFAVLVSTCGSNWKKLIDADDDANESVRRALTANMEVYRETFNIFDQDQSGYIVEKELKNVLASLGQKCTDAEIKKIMQATDSNGDGQISFEEFSDMMQTRLMQRGELSVDELQKAFDVFDEDGDGYISKNELIAISRILGKKKISVEEAEEIIRTVDYNHDGKIDFKEFAAMMSRFL